MAVAPIFIATPRMESFQVTAANTNRDGTGTLVDLTVGASSKTRINKITIQAVGTTTAGMVRLYFHNGTNSRLYLEIPVAPITPSGTIQAFFYQLIFDDASAPILGSSSQKLQGSTHNAETFNIIIESGDY